MVEPRHHLLRRYFLLSPFLRVDKDFTSDSAESNASSPESASEKNPSITFNCEEFPLCSRHF